MKPIKLLSDELASKIAAGEVVERPASVVKELVENAIDAYATEIVVNVNQAGKELIQVQDNGQGIPADELEIAVQRHATSKIDTAEDLFNIHTLGFRGEALASIGSVSRMTIRSKVANSEAGTQILVENGAIKNKDICATPTGTDIRVESLFFSVPARLKFLKTDITEKRHITSLLLKIALAYPAIKFELNFDGKNKFKTTGNNDRREILAIIYDLHIAKEMLLVDTSVNDIEIYGFISPLDITRSSRKDIIFFINGRNVHNSALATAVTNAYHSMLMVNRYPIAVLFIKIDPNEVDVNVHPTKAEVRFKDSQKLFTTIQSTVRRALMAYSPMPKPYHSNTPEAYQNKTPLYSSQPNFGDIFPKNQPSAFEKNLREELLRSDTLTDLEKAEIIGPRTPNQLKQWVDNKAEESPHLIKTPLLRLVGQIAQTYIVAEAPDGLYLIDQHAAHERILYEKYMKNLNDGEIPSQALLTPEIITVPRDMAEIVQQRLPIFNQIGFEIEPFGFSEIIIRSIPAILKNTNTQDAFGRAFEKLEDEDESIFEDVLEELLITRICKRIAVKAGQTLPRELQERLVEDLENCQNPRTCPHGRPTMIHLSIDSLERQFGRRFPL